MHDTRVLNDVAVKSNNLMDSSAALDQNQNQRDMINWAMSQAENDNQFKVGAFGTTFPTGWFNTLLNSSNMSGATQLTKDYVVSVLSLREARRMQKVLTGSARANEHRSRPYRRQCRDSKPIQLWRGRSSQPSRRTWTCFGRVSRDAGH